MKSNSFRLRGSWRGCSFELFVDGGLPHLAGYPNLPDHSFYRGKIERVESADGRLVLGLRKLTVYQPVERRWTPAIAEVCATLDLPISEIIANPRDSEALARIIISPDRQLDIYDSKAKMPEEPREHLDVVAKLARQFSADP